MSNPKTNNLTLPAFVCFLVSFVCFLVLFTGLQRVSTIASPYKSTPLAENNGSSDASNYRPTAQTNTALDQATSDAQDCFARHRGRDQSVCTGTLERMEEAARTRR
jgi:hypothetical protein